MTKPGIASAKRAERMAEAVRLLGPRPRQWGPDQQLWDEAKKNLAIMDTARKRAVATQAERDALPSQRDRDKLEAALRGLLEELAERARLAAAGTPMDEGLMSNERLAALIISADKRLTELDAAHQPTDPELLAVLAPPGAPKPTHRWDGKGPRPTTS